MGQFDETIDPEAGLSVTPVPGLDALASGVPPAMLQGAMPPPAAPMPPMAMPQAPQAPAQPGTLQHILSAALLGLAAGLGPRHGGGGIATGLMAGQQANQDQRQQTFKDQQQQFQQQQQEAIRQQAAAAVQARAVAAEQDRRALELEKAVQWIGTKVKTIPDKATYDDSVDKYAQMLQSAGYRMDGNILRQMVPSYIAPDQEKAIAKRVMDSLAAAEKLHQDPSGILNGSMSIDVIGDGKPASFQLKPTREWMQRVGIGVIVDDHGKPVGTAGGAKDDVQTAFQLKIDRFRAEHKGQEPDAAQREQLFTEARTPVKAPKDPNAPNPNADAQEIAAGIIDGTQPPDLRGMYSKSAGVRAELHRNGYDLTSAQLDWQATQKFMATANGAQQTKMRQSVDNASHSLDLIDALADQWDAGRFPALNAARLAAAKGGALGPEAQKIAAKLSAQIADVTSEFGNVIMGGTSPTDHALKLASDNFGTNWSRPTLKALTDQARKNLQIRMNSIRNTGPVIPGGGASQYAPAPAPAAEPAAANPGRFTIVQKGPQ